MKKINIVLTSLLLMQMLSANGQHANTDEGTYSKNTKVVSDPTLAKIKNAQTDLMTLAKLAIAKSDNEQIKEIARQFVGDQEELLRQPSKNKNPGLRNDYKRSSIQADTTNAKDYGLNNDFSSNNTRGTLNSFGGDTISANKNRAANNSKPLSDSTGINHSNEINNGFNTNNTTGSINAYPTDSTYAAKSSVGIGKVATKNTDNHDKINALYGAAFDKQWISKMISSFNATTAEHEKILSNIKDEQTKLYLTNALLSFKKTRTSLQTLAIKI